MSDDVRERVTSAVLQATDLDKAGREAEAVPMYLQCQQIIRDALHRGVDRNTRERLEWCQRFIDERLSHMGPDSGSASRTPGARGPHRVSGGAVRFASSAPVRRVASSSAKHHHSSNSNSNHQPGAGNWVLGSSSSRPPLSSSEIHSPDRGRAAPRGVERRSSGHHMSYQHQHHHQHQQQPKAWSALPGGSGSAGSGRSLHAPFPGPPRHDFHEDDEEEEEEGEGEEDEEEDDGNIFGKVLHGGYDTRRSKRRASLPPVESHASAAHAAAASSHRPHSVEVRRAQQAQPTAPHRAMPPRPRPSRPAAAAAAASSRGGGGGDRGRMGAGGGRSKVGPSSGSIWNKDSRSSGGGGGGGDGKDKDENGAMYQRIMDEVVSTDLDVEWDDIVGLSRAKQAIQEIVVLPFLRPDLFVGIRSPPRGVLLYGPPGTGKTMLAKAIATESDMTFFGISASSIMSKWVGEGERMVKALFQAARDLQPSVIFVDEIDSLLSARRDGEHDATRRVKTEFLVQFDGVCAGKEGESRILVLGATNIPWALDEAVRRRLSKRVYIPLPNHTARELMIRKHMRDQDVSLTDQQFKQLARAIKGYSGSDIKALCQEAAMGPVREMGVALVHAKASQIRSVQISDFVKALEVVKPSVSKNDHRQFEEWSQAYGTHGS